MKQLYTVKGANHGNDQRKQRQGGSINVFIAGGSGLWCERNHLPAIINIKSKGSLVRLSGISDPVNPYLITHPNLSELVSIDQPAWINPFGLSRGRLFMALSDIHRSDPINFIIIACDPVYHYMYIDWALKNRISIICDKPPVVFENVATDLKSARRISTYYNEIAFKTSIESMVTPGFDFYIPLRRRALSPCVEVYRNLKEIYNKTGEGITHFKLDVYGGIHRYPEEFLKPGAHGYLKGIGSLSHSAYHYVDMIAWYLSAAPGKAEKLQIKLTYIKRVKDYLRAEGYAALQQLMGLKNVFNIQLPNAVLNSELDFGFAIDLLDGKDNKLGIIHFTYNHTSFTTRTSPIELFTNDPANKSNGGRRSHFDMIIQQGPMQSIELRKNDPVHTKYKIQKVRNVHPLLQINHEVTEYYDAHRTETLTPQDLIQHVLDKKYTQPHYAHNISTLESQKFTNKLFAVFYELIAEEYVLSRHKKNSVARKVINIKEFI